MTATSITSTNEFIQTVQQLLKPLGDIGGKQIFGGYGLQIAAKQFAIIRGTTIYFRVDDITRQKYLDKGMQPFSYASTKGIVKVKQYYEAPEELIKYPTLLVKWAKEAVDIVVNKT
ncbi:TfoX/Sxy family protein [Endozoicomonas sp. SM1973]|uniref:TfoX/Sxy family protein n=1 Tax=Spartinivicinus marinus TaxID=2994442 RepID=A0A853IDF7_9GAMM|nr:TfoX/Sxy family protein [Spartinivicinus marinus]MCX4029783.1 TfoX/Sxy family protein [Spartinivicinus marinus]NYZ67547.1 TfoX/Sxy family protein [Spartinivicinus marinus]